MNAKVILLSKKDGDIQKFLNKFLNKKIELEKSNIWQKDFSNPIEISEIVAAFIDNIHSFNLIMWITLDKNIFIKVSPANSNDIIKYLFERYPYQFLSACFSTFITVYVIDAKYTTNTNVGVYTPTGILVIAIKLINSISQNTGIAIV